MDSSSLWKFFRYWQPASRPALIKDVFLFRDAVDKWHAKISFER